MKTFFGILTLTILTRISLLRQLSYYVPENVQRIFYQGYILPLINYGSNTWGATDNSNIDRLNKLRRRAAGIILRTDFTSPSANMFKQLGWASVASRLQYNKAVLTYKALNDLTPSYISDLLKLSELTSSFHLRSSDNGFLTVPRSRTVLYDGSFSCSAPKLWNSLPYSIRSVPSLDVFKKVCQRIFLILSVHLVVTVRLFSTCT